MQKHYVDAIRSHLSDVRDRAARNEEDLSRDGASPSRPCPIIQVGRIILTRPAVEAGERLGFLPGDMLAKVDPYLRPLFDALYDMLDADRLNAYMERGTIEVAPLAFMRGRTLNDSFIILDEAQNTSPEQMQMFLTRLGFGSRVVVTGDVTQIDLPRDQASGRSTEEILGGVDGIAFVRFSHKDVVRHKLVQRIVEAYKQHAETGTAAAVMLTVEVDNRSGRAVDAASAIELARRVLEAEGVADGELGLAFVQPDEIRALKQRHLGADEATDVLSFPLDGRGAIAAERATCPRRSPLPRGRRRGLARPLVHGLLHLLGYDHGPAMEKREEAYR